MDTMVDALIKRADTEMMLAEKLKILSEEIEAKKFMKIPENVTFYSSVISHSYYAIFYAAKAILLAKDIKTSAPEIHKKTFEEFKKNLVDNGGS